MALSILVGPKRHPYIIKSPSWGFKYISRQKTLFLLIEKPYIKKTLHKRFHLKNAFICPSSLRSLALSRNAERA